MSLHLNTDRRGVLSATGVSKRSGCQVDHVGDVWIDTERHKGTGSRATQVLGVFPGEVQGRIRTTSSRNKGFTRDHPFVWFGLGSWDQTKSRYICYKPKPSSNSFAHVKQGQKPSSKSGSETRSVFLTGTLLTGKVDPELSIFRSHRVASGGRVS